MIRPTHLFSAAHDHRASGTEMREPVYDAHLLSATRRSVRSTLGVSLERTSHGVR
jgi:hypothetical protein